MIPTNESNACSKIIPKPHFSRHLVLALCSIKGEPWAKFHNQLEIKGKFAWASIQNHKDHSVKYDHILLLSCDRFERNRLSL